MTYGAARLRCPCLGGICSGVGRDSGGVQQRGGVYGAAGFELANSSGTVLGASSYAITPNVKLNFTEITSTYVRGTFSGNMAATAGGTAVLVSNGIFYLPIQ